MIRWLATGWLIVGLLGCAEEDGPPPEELLPGVRNIEDTEDPEDVGASSEGEPAEGVPESGGQARSCEKLPAWSESPPCKLGEYVYAAGTSRTHFSNTLHYDYQSRDAMHVLVEAVASQSGGSVQLELRQFEGVQGWVCQQDPESSTGSVFSLVRSSDEKLVKLEWPECTFELGAEPQAWIEDCPPWTGALEWKQDGKVHGVSATSIEGDAKTTELLNKVAAERAKRLVSALVNAEGSEGKKKFRYISNPAAASMEFTAEETETTECGPFRFAHYSATPSGEPPAADDSKGKKKGKRKGKKGKRKKKRRKR